MEGGIGVWMEGRRDEGREGGCIYVLFLSFFLLSSFPLFFSIRLGSFGICIYSSSGGGGGAAAAASSSRVEGGFV